MTLGRTGTVRVQGTGEGLDPLAFQGLNAESEEGAAELIEGRK